MAFLKRHILLFLLLISGAVRVQPHSGESHGDEPAAGPAALSAVAEAYRASVEPLFEKKCFDCHGVLKQKPWYASLPGIKGIIEKDIREGKSHMNMTGGFPFGGHAGPRADLYEIREVVEDDSMPPRLYRLVHWDSPLTEAEKKVVLDWVEKSLKRLESSPGE